MARSGHGRRKEGRNSKDGVLRSSLSYDEKLYTAQRSVGVWVKGRKLSKSRLIKPGFEPIRRYSVDTMTGPAFRPLTIAVTEWRDS